MKTFFMFQDENLLLNLKNLINANPTTIFTEIGIKPYK